MRNRFDNQLAEMNNELISMGALCENAIASAVKALLSGTLEFNPAVHCSHHDDGHNHGEGHTCGEHGCKH